MNGISFKPDMIQAIVEGRKTVTRRTMTPQPVLRISDEQFKKKLSQFSMPVTMLGQRYHVGETVYVKEAWAKVYDDWPPYEEEEQTPFHIEYKIDTGNQYPGNWPADCKDDEACGRWRSPLFLPEKFARYFIKIESVRPERLQEITEEDALKEGIVLKAVRVEGNLVNEPTYVESYAMLWDSINGKGSWDKNPWIFRYEFQAIKREEEIWQTK